MSEKLITAEQARNMMDRNITLWSGHGGIAWHNDLTLERIATPDDALHTIIAQDAQIKRLQAALREAEVKRRQVWVEMGANIDPHGAVDWETQYDALTAEDMEDTDE